MKKIVLESVFFIFITFLSIFSSNGYNQENTSLEERLETAWNEAYINYIAQKPEIEKAIILEKTISRAKELAKTYKKYSFSYTYLSNLARENLEEEVYVPYIKDNILKVVAFSGFGCDGLDTFCGRSKDSFHITDIEWLENNKAKVYFNENLAGPYNNEIIIVGTKDNKLFIEPTESLRIISFSIFGLNLDTSIREPIDWPFLLDDGTTFYYMTSEKYFDKDVVNKDIYRKKLFSIEYYMKGERQRMLDEGEAINKTKITEIENVVIVYTIYYENNDKDNEELSKIFNDLPKMLERVVIEKH